MNLKITIGFLFFTPTIFFGMSNKLEYQPAKFDSSKDFHHLYHNPHLMRSLQAICLGAIAQDVKDNIDPDNPFESQETIEEIIAQLKERDISSKCLFDYWQAHTQPTWKLATSIPGEINVKHYNQGMWIWHEKNFNKIGILNDDIVSYKPNPFVGLDCITATPDNKYIAISDNNVLVIFSNQHLFPIIYRNSILNNIRITTLSFSSHSNALFIGMENGSIHQLSVDQNKTQDKWKCCSVGKHEWPIKHIVCAPNNSYIVSADTYNTCHKWNRKIQNSEAADHFTSEKISTYSSTHTSISEIIISPDSNFILLTNNHCDVCIFDVMKQEKKRVNLDVNRFLFFSPTNNLVVLKLGLTVIQSLDFSSNTRKVVRQIFSPDKASEYFNFNELNSCFSTKKYSNSLRSFITYFYTLEQPSLTQLLYKLALEAAIKQGKKKSLKKIGSHLLSFNYNREPTALSQKLNYEMISIDPKKVAQKFVDRYIVSAWKDQEPIDSILNEEFLQGYDAETFKEICRLSHEFWFTHMWKKACKEGLESQLSCFYSESCNYLLCTASILPFEFFNALVENNSDILTHLQAIYVANLEQKLGAAHPFRKIANVKEKIDEAYRIINTTL